MEESIVWLFLGLAGAKMALISWLELEGSSLPSGDLDLPD